MKNLVLIHNGFDLYVSFIKTIIINKFNHNAVDIPFFGLITLNARKIVETCSKHNIIIIYSFE
jgi:hypothetical protein